MHQRKNHTKPIQKFHHNSTHSQPTAKRLGPPPSHQTTKKLSLSSTPSSAALTAQAYVQSPPPLPTKIKICYNTTTQQKIKQQSGIHIPLHQTLMNAITNQSHSESKERQGKT